MPISRTSIGQQITKVPSKRKKETNYQLPNVTEETSFWKKHWRNQFSPIKGERTGSEKWWKI